MDADKAHAFGGDVQQRAQAYLEQNQQAADSAVSHLERLGQVTRHQPVMDAATNLRSALQMLPMWAGMQAEGAVTGDESNSLLPKHVRSALDAATKTANHYSNFGLGTGPEAANARNAAIAMQALNGALSDDALNTNVLDPAAERYLT